MQQSGQYTACAVYRPDCGKSRYTRCSCEGSNAPHWARLLPGQIAAVQYEMLVSEPESQIPELLARVGLDVEEACLNFHQTERPVRTASALQVCQPIYRQALAGYRTFDAQLQPLYRALDRHGAAPENALDDG